MKSALIMIHDTFGTDLRGTQKKRQGVAFL